MRGRSSGIAYWKERSTPASSSVRQGRPALEQFANFVVQSGIKSCRAIKIGDGAVGNAAPGVLESARYSAADSAKASHAMRLRGLHSVMALRSFDVTGAGNGTSWEPGT
jgi:hypothetical protein